jgi:hypothetical protein
VSTNSSSSGRASWHPTGRSVNYILLSLYLAFIQVGFQSASRRCLHQALSLYKTYPQWTHRYLCSPNASGPIHVQVHMPQDPRPIIFGTYHIQFPTGVSCRSTQDPHRRRKHPKRTTVSQTRRPHRPPFFPLSPQHALARSPDTHRQHAQIIVHNSEGTLSARAARPRANRDPDKPPWHAISPTTKTPLCLRELVRVAHGGTASEKSLGVHPDGFSRQAEAG